MTRTILITDSVLLLLLLASSHADSAEPKALLMMDIRAQGVPEEIAGSLTDLLELEIERGRLYRVISQQDLRTLIKVEEQKLLLGKDEEFNQQVAKIAKLVDAPYVLASTLGKVGEAYLLSLELLDANEVKVLRRVSQTLIGDEKELIGSLRSAVLAITLDEKGVAPDISEELIDKLHIAQKEKSVFLSISPAVEIPMGKRATDRDLPAFRPTFLHLRLDAEFPVWRWIRLYGSVSVGTTLNERLNTEDDHVASIFRVGEPNPVETRVQANLMTLDYSALRIPVNVGVKLVPDNGRFLPFALAGVGISWQGYTFTNGDANVIREPLPDGTCPPPFEGPISDLPQCVIENIEMKPEGDVSTFAFDAVAAVGFEWLLSHHIGLVAQVRYHLSVALKSTKDLTLSFYGASDTYQVDTPQGPEDRYDRHLEVFTLQDLHEGLVFSIGLITYW